MNREPTGPEILALIKLVIAMRKEQAEFFRSPVGSPLRQGALRRSRVLERQVDRECARLLPGEFKLM